MDAPLVEHWAWGPEPLRVQNGWWVRELQGLLERWEPHCPGQGYQRQDVTSGLIGDEKGKQLAGVW